MTCCSCKYLNEEKKLDGKVSGCEYFCNKNKWFINGQDNACDKYESSFRGTNRCNEIYNDGKNFYNDTHSVSYYLFILIVIIIIAIIARISNPEFFPF